MPPDKCRPHWVGALCQREAGVVMTPGDRPRVVVIGAGVSGWTTAMVLAKRGWQVVVAADGFGIDAVSSASGAMWEWPPSRCGRYHDQAVLARYAGWAMRSYLRFAQLASDPGTGVGLRPAVYYFGRRIEDDPIEFAKMSEVKRFVPGFVHDPALIDRHGVNRDSGVIDAYSYLAPTIDTDWYLAWLAREAKNAGVCVDRRRIFGPLINQENRLLTEYRAELIINCAGLGARELAEDTTVVPHRGALLRVLQERTATSRVTAAHVVANDAATDQQNLISIVPRGSDQLVLGGLVEPDRYDTELNLADYPPLRTMFDRCVEFLPALRSAAPDVIHPVRVGLRPFRRDGVRLEAQRGTRIVHNYGHGGAGISLSWGCAQEVADLAYRIFARKGVA